MIWCDSSDKQHSNPTGRRAPCQNKDINIYTNWSAASISERQNISISLFIHMPCDRIIQWKVEIRVDFIWRVIFYTPICMANCDEPLGQRQCSDGGECNRIRLATQPNTRGTGICAQLPGYRMELHTELLVEWYRDEWECINRYYFKIHCHGSHHVLGSGRE